MGSVPFAVGAFSKLFLKAGCRNVRVDGLPAFLQRLKSDRGVLTVANHVSVVDEPFMWGSLPLRNFLNSKTLRWTLGASDIMFNGKLDRWFFTKGQIIETHRGKGIYQKAIDDSARLLDEGNWVHIFPEGRIKQEELHELRRFKWGISRMLMECERVPLIVPVWIKGFEQVMDEPRVWPNYLPRTGKDVTILYGEPMNAAVEPLLAAYRAQYPTPWRPATYERPVGQDLEDEPDEVGRMRSEIAEAMRQGLMQLGQRVDEVERGPPSRIAGW
ncbi:lysophosphatidylcholine acyltransferase [Rhodotorula paludigena]|uniref:lysophosphatidylcholine acyltransferase n=1 Tax=Rhodotorula paludigena TaxID=86838 RepID=UPI00317039F2